MMKINFLIFLTTIILGYVSVNAQIQGESCSKNSLLVTVLKESVVSYGAGFGFLPLVTLETLYLPLGLVRPFDITRTILNEYIKFLKASSFPPITITAAGAGILTFIKAIIELHETIKPRH